MCYKGKCVCTPGYGGLSCNMQAMCHFWDTSLLRWNDAGIHTERGDPNATGVVGSSGSLKCTAHGFPLAATEFAAIWVPLLPPSPPAAPPGIGFWAVRGTFTIAGIAEDFDKFLFEQALRRYSPNVGELRAVEITVTPASVRASTRTRYDDKSDAENMLGKLQNATLEELSTALGVTVESLTDLSLETLDTPSIILLPLTENPVFQTILVLFVMNIFSLLGLGVIRWKFENGLLSARRVKDADKETKKEPDTVESKSAEADAQQPLALMGPTDGGKDNGMPSLPQLHSRFEVEGDIGQFAEAQFIRRLATLVGVRDLNISATLSTASASNAIAIDTEIACPDATTLVMAAKTLKKAPGPLGLALGVKLLTPPTLTVPEEEPQPIVRQSPERGPVGSTAEAVAPTIQERIPGIGGRMGGTSRRLVAGMSQNAPQAAVPKAAKGFAMPSVPFPAKLGTEDWKFGLSGAGIGLGATPPAPAAGSRSPAAPTGLPGGIQERISFAGMQRSNTRGAAALRMRSTSQARVDPMLSAQSPPQVGGDMLASPPASVLGGVLGGLNLSMTELQESIPAVPAVREGIQERLPAMPGMQKRGTARRVTREPPAGQNASAPIQERLPRMPPADPPPSPPEQELKGNKGTALVPKAPVVSATSTALIKSEENVKAAKAEGDLPIAFDARSVKAILMNCAREHTLVGLITAFLFGDGPKLPTVFQAMQIFYGGILGLLFLSCAQIRYTWLGPTWVQTQSAAAFGITSNKAALIFAVSVAATLVGYPIVVVSRWLFLLANRVKPESTKRQAKLVFLSAWSILLLTQGAFAVGAISMSSNMDATIVKNDVMLGFGIGLILQWFLIEPIAVTTFANLILLLKWCTTFDDLPEVKALMVKRKKEAAEKIKAEKIREREEQKRELELAQAANAMMSQ